MNQIDPTAIIGDNVELGDNNIIGAYCVIGGPYWSNAWEGEKHDQRAGKVIIGDNNLIVHQVTILSPLRTKETRIGNNNRIYSHNFIGHDVRIYNRIIMTAGCLLAGMVTIQNQVNLGMGTAIKERLTIGQGAQLGMGSVIIRDVLPYDKVVGNPARSIGLNTANIDRYVSQTTGIKKLIYKLVMKIWNKIYKIISINN